MDVHIAAIEYALPMHSLTLDELARDGRLTSRPEALRGFGFERAWIAGAERDGLAARAVTALLERNSIDPASIDLLLYAGATSASHALGGRRWTFSRARAIAVRIHASGSPTSDSFGHDAFQLTWPTK